MFALKSNNRGRREVGRREGEKVGRRKEGRKREKSSTVICKM